MQTALASETLSQGRCEDHGCQNSARKWESLERCFRMGPRAGRKTSPKLTNSTNDQKYDVFISRMEQEVVSLLALDDKAAKRFVGRAEGPKFAQVNALEQGLGGTRRTTAVSRAWRRTAGWLHDLLETERQLVTEASILKLLCYRHPSPPPLKANPEQMKSFSEFLNWKRRLTREMLGHKSWVLALKVAATNNAERQEKAAQHASLVKWTQWIHEGPADGQRRQHKFTRTVKGWTPTAKSTGIIPGHGPA